MSETPHTQGDGGKTSRFAVILISVVLCVYLVLLALGLPQKWTAAQHAHHDVAINQKSEESDATAKEEATLTQNSVDAETEDATAEAETAITVAEEESVEEEALQKEADTESETAVPPLWTATPFAILLLCIAAFPLIPHVEHWWESNRHRFYVAAGLGVAVLAYYAFICDFPIDLHWPAHKVVSPDDGAFAMASATFINAIVGEYISFIVLLFALFSITGGIRISGDLKASPGVNTLILAIGAFLASLVGTTGAAMLLIRLLLDTNKERKYKVHTVVFFIFCVCNIGGCLLPIGDPPLFLGYLRGVSFLWTLSLWREWLFVSGILLAIFFVIDKFIFYPKETPLNKALDNAVHQPLRISGLWPNLPCLVGVVLAVMLLDPAQEFLALFNVKTNWYPPMFLREFVQMLMVLLSFLLGSKEIREKNNFNFAPILEVAALFFGIFICMQAPLQILNAKGAQIAETVHQYGSKIKLNEPKEFFWISGSLSSVLDNAPTYVVFFETARAASENELKDAVKEGNIEKQKEIEAILQEGRDQAGVGVPLKLLIAVSLGSVFMGAMTYIGNGPNFMVKAIAEQSGVKMPSFFGYIGYSVCLLLPVLIIMTLVFL